MKVKELKKLLKECDDNDDVLVASDSEGNNFFLVSSVETNYSWDGEYDAEIGLRELTPEFEDAGYGEEDVMEDGTPCIILWP